MGASKKDKVSSAEQWDKLFFACGGAIMLNFFNGIVEAHSAVLLTQLQAADTSIQITRDEETWIASLGILATPLSSLLCGPCVDYFGRKLVIQFYFLTSALGYGVIAAATSVAGLYIGRAFCSLAIGFEVASVVYIAEVCTKHQRSLYMSLSFSLYTVGILFTYIIGAALPWNHGSAVYMTLCLLVVLYQSFTPESPHWLVKENRINHAIVALKRLGRNEADISEEINILQKNCRETTNEQLEWRTFIHPTVWKPFLIISLFHILQSCTGTWDLLYYTVDCIDELGTQYDAYTISIGLAIVRFLTMSTVGLYCMTKVGRKTSTAISGLSMGVTFLIAGVYESHFKGVPPSQRPDTWIPILAILVSVLVSCAGVVNLPWVMSGEVFPLRVRGAMGGASYFVGSVSMFLSLKYYVFFIEYFSVTGTLFLCAIASVAIGVFGAFVLTETQNKSLHEIEASYQKFKMADEDEKECLLGEYVEKTEEPVFVRRRSSVAQKTVKSVTFMIPEESNIETESLKCQKLRC